MRIKLDKHKLSDALARNRKAEKSCMTSTCRNKAIGSHQISVSQIKQIEDANTHLTVCRPIEPLLLKKDVHNLFTNAKRSDALTFQGFCAKCDQQIFADLDDTSTPLSRTKILQQAYRSFCYHNREYEVNYRSMIDTWSGQSLTKRQMPCWRLSDKRVATNLAEEWAYVRKGFEQYRKSFVTALSTSDTAFHIISEKINFAFLPMRFASSNYLNAGFWGKPLGLNWDNAGQYEPLVFMQLLQFSDGISLSIVTLQSHKAFAEKIIQQIKEIPPKDRGFQFFRFACHTNLGTILGQDFLKRTKSSWVNEVKDIEDDAKILQQMKPGREWQNYPTPDGFPEMRFEND